MWCMRMHKKLQMQQMRGMQLREVPLQQTPAASRPSSGKSGFWQPVHAVETT